MTTKTMTFLAAFAISLVSACAESPGYEGELELGPEPAPVVEPDGGGEGEEPPPSDDAFFELENVLDVAVDLDPEDWDALRAQTRSLADILGGDCLDHPPSDAFSWFSATVTVNGETLSDVGVRKKGFLGSLSETKPSLKLKFDKYVDDQLLSGVMRRLTLNNARQDASKLNTCMTYQAFADAGLPAPRCNFATVSVNGVRLGLYVHVEAVKEEFLERHFQDASGNLYEGTLSDFRPVWSRSFEKMTNRDERDRSDIEAVVDAMALADDDYLEALQGEVDVDHFLSFWAMEVLTGHWDGYSGNRNNYLIYREPQGRFVFIPWGPDSSFRPLQNPFNEIEDPQSVMAATVIPHRFYHDDVMRGAYIERLKSLLDTVWDEEALVERAEKMEAIAEANSLDEFRSWVNSDARRVRNFVRRRRELILAEVEPTPVDWPEALGEPNICWEELGAVDLSFETTWGSNSSEDPLGEGEVSIETYRARGETLTFVRSGAVAGLGERGEERPAKIAIISMMPDDVIDVIDITFPAEKLAGGTKVNLDQRSADAIRLLLYPPDYREPQYYGRVSGVLELEEAGDEAGAKTSGRLSGTLYSFGGYVSGSNTREPPPDSSGLVINEVSAKGEPLDWFEVHNTSAQDVEMSDFTLSDDLLDPRGRVPFPDGTIIEAGGYVVFEVDRRSWPAFALGADEELGLWNAEGALVDSVDWAAQDSDEGTSYARIPDATGAFQASVLPTPGASNR